jgi:hypothetical protein
VRRRTQAFANRLVYGRRATPYEVLSQFSDRLAGAYSVDDVLPRMAQIVAQGTGSNRGEIWLRVGDRLRRESEWPEPAIVSGSLPVVGEELPVFPAGTDAFPVRHLGELLGR